MQESFDRDLIIVLHEVAHSLRTRADRAARAHGMTRAQWIILARLARQPGISQNELASICEVEPITIGRLVDRLEARGLVERCADPSDRRVRRLKLLPRRAADRRGDHGVPRRIECRAGRWPERTASASDLIDALLRIKNNLVADGTNCPKRQAAGG